MIEPDSAPAGASKRSAHSFVDQDGSIQIHSLTLPPSALWSAEYAAFHKKSTALPPPGTEVHPIPARSATKEEWDRFDAWWDRRFNSEALAEALRIYSVTVNEENIAGVRTAVVIPREGVAPENRDRVLINLHGGGFVFHRGLSFGQLESIPVASLGGIKVVTIDYRQAPFHRFPAATEDVLHVYEELLKQHDAEAIGIYGCSAGGTLTSQVVSSLQARGLPRPGAIGLSNMAPMPFCRRPPWGREWGESGMWFSGVPKNEMSAPDRAVWDPVLWYMDLAEPQNLEAYPGGSDAVLSKFPATLFVSGTRDFCMSAVVYSHARFLRLGVAASLYIMEGGGHASHVSAVGTPEAHHLYAYIARWFREHLC